MLKRANFVIQSLSLTAFLSAFLAGATGRAQESTAKPTGLSADIEGRPAVATVLAKFEGGLIASDMASVIAAFTEKARVLPSKLYLPQQTVGLCSILETELELRPSTLCNAHLIEAIRMLNKQEGVTINPNAINSNTGVFLPAVRASQKVVPRLFDLSNPAEAERIAILLNNPAWAQIIKNPAENVVAQFAKEGDNAPAIVQIEISRISWEFDIRDEGLLSVANYIARQLASRNVAVSVERANGFQKPIHAPSYSALEHYQKWCSPTPPTAAEGAFADIPGQLYDTTAVIACEQPAIAPEIMVMDRPITYHPDFYKALPSQPTAGQPILFENTCREKTFEQKRDHGMMLATILASSANNYGFRGIVPEVQLKPFVWADDQVTHRQLQEFIEDAWNPKVPQVYLFASDFKPFDPIPAANADEFDRLNASATWRTDGNGGWVELLADELVRTRPEIVKELFHLKILMVASAGQTVDHTVGKSIDWETPLSPQNLGDYENILVVGACSNCDKATAALWPESNRGKDIRFVGLLAPGGGEIPFYTSPVEVTKTTGGTSAAAAFVAGVAARMAACYPSSYAVRPGNLKERIILASRPILPNQDSADSVAGGVLDPSVSMLDPSKTWLKLNTRPEPNHVEFKRWCASRFEYRDENGTSRDSFNLKVTRRVTALGGRLVLQSAFDLPDRNPSPLRKRIVERAAPGVPAVPGAIAVVEDNGVECSVTTGRLTDLFLDKAYTTVAACEETIKPCE